MEITRIGDHVLGWGESVVWDDRRQRLYMVDCAARTLHWLEGGGGPLHTRALPSMPAGGGPAGGGRVGGGGGGGAGRGGGGGGGGGRRGGRGRPPDRPRPGGAAGRLPRGPGRPGQRRL